MSSTFHLVCNTIPVGIILTGAIILLMGIMSHSLLLKKTALITMVMAALFTLFVAISGYNAREEIRSSNPNKMIQINQHTEKAQSAILMIEVLGILSFIAYYLINKHNSASSSLIALCLVLSIVVSFSMLRLIHSVITVNHTITLTIE